MDSNAIEYSKQFFIQANREIKNTRDVYFPSITTQSSVLPYGAPCPYSQRSFPDPHDNSNRNSCLIQSNVWNFKKSIIPQLPCKSSSYPHYTAWEEPRNRRENDSNDILAAFRESIEFIHNHQKPFIPSRPSSIPYRIHTRRRCDGSFLCC